jgi:hypothetical protein
MEGHMVQLTLTDQDAATLKRALETYLSDLRMEVADTDAQDFREDLKQEESVIKRLVEQLEGRRTVDPRSSTS